MKHFLHLFIIVHILFIQRKIFMRTFQKNIDLNQVQLRNINIIFHTVKIMNSKSGVMFQSYLQEIYTHEASAMRLNV